MHRGSTTTRLQHAVQNSQYYKTDDKLYSRKIVLKQQEDLGKSKTLKQHTANYIIVMWFMSPTTHTTFTQVGTNRIVNKPKWLTNRIVNKPCD